MHNKTDALATTAWIRARVLFFAGHLQSGEEATRRGSVTRSRFFSTIGSPPGGARLRRPHGKCALPQASLRVRCASLSRLITRPSGRAHAAASGFAPRLAAGRKEQTRCTALATPSAPVCPGLAAPGVCFVIAFSLAYGAALRTGEISIGTGWCDKDLAVPPVELGEDSSLSALPSRLADSNR